MNSNLRSLYFRALRDLYSLELQLISLVPQISSQVSRETRQELEAHLRQSRSRRNCLEVMSLGHDISIAGDPCLTMRALIERGRTALAQTSVNHLRDAITMAMCDHIRHLVVSGYSAARLFAAHLGFGHDVADLDALLEMELEPCPSVDRWSRSQPQADLLPA